MEQPMQVIKLNLHKLEINLWIILTYVYAALSLTFQQIFPSAHYAGYLERDFMKSSTVYSSTTPK